MLGKHHLREKRGFGLNVTSQSHSRESYLVNGFSILSFQQHESTSKTLEKFANSQHQGHVYKTHHDPERLEKFFREAIERSQ